MVFGKTHCAISHLPIDDGDHCILVPLMFKMEQKFGEYSQEGINDFEWLYIFHDKAVEVEYGGNPQEIFLLVNRVKYSEWKMYMLVRKDVYQEIQDYFKDSGLYKDVGSFMPSKTTIHLYDLLHKIRDEIISDFKSDVIFGRAKKEDYPIDIQIPEWIRELLFLNYFMGRMGIAPHSMIGIDQSGEAGKRYWEIIDKCRNS